VWDNGSYIRVQITCLLHPHPRSLVFSPSYSLFSSILFLSDVPVPAVLLDFSPNVRFAESEGCGVGYVYMTEDEV
jgi:hypothetical protein